MTAVYSGSAPSTSSTNSLYLVSKTDGILDSAMILLMGYEKLFTLKHARLSAF
jgi:hypothetical protein